MTFEKSDIFHFLEVFISEAPVYHRMEFLSTRGRTLYILIRLKESNDTLKMHVFAHGSSFVLFRTHNNSQSVA